VEWTAPISLEAYCLNEEIALSATPSGGAFSGAGVSGNTFITGDAGVGNFTVNYTFTDSNGCTGTAVSPVIAVSSCYASLEENEAFSRKVFPNPTGGIINVWDTQIIKRLTVYSSAGKQVWDHVVNAEAVQMDISGLAGGVYSLKMEGKNGEVSFIKIILIK
jgi:hypothetical protein